MKQILKLSFLFLSLLFSINIDLYSQSSTSSLCHNFYDGAITQALEIWKTIDIVRAIKQTKESRTHFANQLFDNFINLHSDIQRLDKHNITYKEIEDLISLLNNIKINFFDVFYDVEGHEFFFICLLLGKIDKLLEI